MHFTFYLGDSGRIGLNLQFKSDVKSGLSSNIFMQNYPLFYLIRALLSGVHVLKGFLFS